MSLNQIGARFAGYFPPNLDTSALYPEQASAYTFPDGTTAEVACFAPGKGKIIQDECPFPFVHPILPNSTVPCVQPCPNQVYSKEEYTQIWGVSIGIELLGLLLNAFMMFTWLVFLFCTLSLCLRLLLLKAHSTPLTFHRLQGSNISETYHSS
jgi:hypothetical protein